jgi:hypothetical protein
MISAKLLQRAIDRIASLRYFPTGNPEAKTIAGEILRELCADDDELSRAIALIPRILSEWEGPAELWAKLSQALEAGRVLDLPKPCQRCSERDMVVTETDGSAVAGRCTCLRGKRLSELDAQKRAARR